MRVFANIVSALWLIHMCSKFMGVVAISDRGAKAVMGSVGAPKWLSAPLMKGP